MSERLMRPARAHHDLRTSTTTSSISVTIARRDLQPRGANEQPPDDPGYDASEMGKGISVPFSHLVLYHREIGIHRGRRAGFRDVFRFQTLHDLPFIKLAKKVKDAYEGRDVPSHDGWPAQRDALRWFVEQGRDAIYALDDKPIKVRHCPYQRFYIADGHHRALALYILGEREISAKVKR